MAVVAPADARRDLVGDGGAVHDRGADEGVTRQLAREKEPGLPDRLEAIGQGGQVAAIADVPERQRDRADGASLGAAAMADAIG